MLFQVLSNYVWLVATILDGTDTEHFHNSGYITQLYSAGLTNLQASLLNFYIA